MVPGKGEVENEQDDAEAVEFAILEAAAAAEVEAEAEEEAKQRRGLADVCSVPPLPDHPGVNTAAWYVKAK